MLIPVVLALVFLFGLAPRAPVAAVAPRYSEASQIIAIARAQIGHRFRMGAIGPRFFDCSGLVIYAYRRAGDGRLLGRSNRTSQQMYHWFKVRGLASRGNPKVGDLVVWGGGRHIGLYIGNGQVISALRRGVAVHRVSAFSLPFTAYLHTGMDKRART